METVRNLGAFKLGAGMLRVPSTDFVEHARLERCTGKWEEIYGGLHTSGSVLRDRASEISLLKYIPEEALLYGLCEPANPGSQEVSPGNPAVNLITRRKKCSWKNANCLWRKTHPESIGHVAAKTNRVGEYWCFHFKIHIICVVQS